MSTAKHEIELLLKKLPDDCSLEDVQYHLYVLEKVRRGLEEARLQGTIPQEEAEPACKNGLPSSVVAPRPRRLRGNRRVYCRRLSLLL
jgi:hypothetical protein